MGSHHARAIAAALLLAGCAQERAAADWPTREACRALDGETVRAAANLRTIAAEGTVVETGTVTMTTCNWRFADHPGHVALLLRTSEAGDYSEAAVAAARSGGGVIPPSVEVPGLGRAALWNARMHSLMVFVDDRRMMTLGFVRPPAGLDTKAAAIRLARDMIG